MPAEFISRGGTKVAARWQLDPPLTADHLAAIGPEPLIAQFNRPLSLAEHTVLGEWAARHGQVNLRPYGTERDLEFLAAYPALAGLTVDLAQLVDDSGLRFLGDTVQDLRAGRELGHLATTISRLPALERLVTAGTAPLLQVVSRLDRLVELRIGPVRSLPSLSAMLSLRRLHLTKADLPGLDGLGELPALVELTLLMGATTDLSALPVLPCLQVFECERVRGLRDVSPTFRVPTLQRLELGPLGGVTSLPDLSAAASLTELTLSLAHLTDLTALATAPALTGSLRIAAKGPEDLNDLAPLASLRPADFYLNLGSRSRTLAAWDVLRIPGRYWDQQRP